MPPSFLYILPWETEFMPADTQFRSVQSGNKTLTAGLSFPRVLEHSSVASATVMGSSESGGYLYTNDTALTSIKVGLFQAGGFVRGTLLTYTNWHYKCPATAASWTQFTALATSITSDATIDLFQASSPSTSKTFNLGVLPNNNNKGHLNGQTVVRIFFE